jgi:hypothetical protein
MAEEATQEVEQTSSAENTAAESQTVEQTTQDAGDTQQSTEQTSDIEGKADAASTGEKKPSETQDVKPESKPLSRRSAAYRIQQLVNENNELKKQVGKPKQEQNEWEEETAQDDQPNIAELVAKEVERRLNPIVSESSKAADDSEINELFSGEKAGERTKYEPKIREMWKLPQYKDVAASELYKIASFDDAVSSAVTKGIEEYKKAEKEAKDSSASGTSNSNRTGKGGKSITDLSDEEFAARNERIKAGLPV